MEKSLLQIQYIYFAILTKLLYTEANVIYSLYRRNCYILLDISSFKYDITTLKVIINNLRFTNKYSSIYTILLDRKYVNIKFKITKCLISIFYGLPIKKYIKDWYFNKFRTLLLDKLKSISNYYNKNIKNNKETKSYI